MVITIGSGSQQIWQGYGSYYRDHHRSTDEGGLDETKCQLVIKMLGMNKGYLLALQAPI